MEKKNLRMDDQEAEGEYSNKNSLSFVQCPDLSHSQTWNTLTDKKRSGPQEKQSHDTMTKLLGNDSCSSSIRDICPYTQITVH